MSENSALPKHVRNLPDGWRHLPIKRVADTFSGAGFPIDQQGVTDEEIPFHKVASLSGADSTGWIHGSDDTISKSTAANLRAPLLDSGTIVIAKIGAALLLGRIRQLAQRSTIDNNMLGIIASGSHARFLYFALQTLDFAALVNPGAVPSLSDRNLRMWPIMLPPDAEQQQIAAFLDRETGQIDALITKQEQLVETLTERRQAVIAQAVTRGLDPTVEVKASGVDWLGDIPSGWRIQRLKRLGSTQIGLTYDPDDIVGEESGTLVLRSGNVQGGQISLVDKVYVSTRIPLALRLREGDILICARNGSRALIGKNAKIGPELVGETFGAFMSVLRSDVGDYLRWVLNSSIFQFQMGSFVTATINQLTNGTLNNFEIPVPPRREQLEIIDYLTDETVRLDALVVKARQVVEVLKERRQALISAAVTGKIDVRGL
ncbi:restriction endonuclease subunit S [Cryobacterium sp. Y29]|uniref:restriction endonuclease subunit S n=1 Tax=Cryobacterium sp. Y29 TaxID=2048285 RepID=UPI000CE52D73|nr:restriction endonuclease subunit S [Cryobacterium sp. Y29]